MRLPDGRIRKLRRSCEDPSSAHELTFSCYKGLPLLGSERTCRWFIDALDAARRKHRLELWAYVIMPEHVHILFAPLDPAYRIRRVLQSIKQPPMRRTINWLKRNNPAWLENLRARPGDDATDDGATMRDNHGLSSLGRFLQGCKPSRARPDRATLNHRATRKPEYHFWQPGGGYDRDVNNVKTAWSIVDYIHDNPVKRGLVERPMDWPWSSARWYMGEGEVVLPMDACPPEP